MGTSARQFAATYDHHEMDTAVRRGQAEYASLVGPAACAASPPPPPPPSAPPPAAPHGMLHGAPMPPSQPPRQQQQQRAESGDGDASASGGASGGSESPSEQHQHALALYGMESGDDVAARLAAAHPKRQKQLALGARAQRACAAHESAAAVRPCARPADARHRAAPTRAAAAAAPRGRYRAFPLLPSPPLSADNVRRLETGAAVRAAVEHFWRKPPAGGNLAYWRRRLQTG